MVECIHGKDEIISWTLIIYSRTVLHAARYTEKATLESFADEVIKAYGRIDYLINNACLSRKGIISGCEYEDFNYVLKVGVTAPYMLAKLFFNYFCEDGAIVNISSTRAVMSQIDTESYTAAKGGISALTHALAVSLAGKLRVNNVSPGLIDVSSSENHSAADRYQHPVHRVDRPLDIARAVMFLCDADNGFITGENITVDVGMTKQMIYGIHIAFSISAIACFTSSIRFSAPLCEKLSL